MLQPLITFAAFSMVSAALLSLLPEGGIKHTAVMVIGLLTLMCWAGGIAQLLHLQFPAPSASSIFTPTSVSLDAATASAAASLRSQWEETP